MSGYGPQDLGVALVAVAALGWLLWRRLHRGRGKPVATCPDCPVAAPIKGTRPAPMPRFKPTPEGTAFLARQKRGPLIQIGGLEPPSRERR